MGALSGAYYGVGYHIIQSGFYYIPRLSGYIGRMDLYIHFLISTDLYRSYLSESFLALSKVFAEKTLSNLHILTFSSNDACPGNTMATEYVSYSCWPEFYERASYFSIPIVMDYISSFMLSTLCMIGGTMTVLLKEWMIDHQRVSQMEKVHVLSEVEQLKEQVSPELLFKTLHHSGELTLSEPEKASKMLMKLSQLLRYQLYDCSRTKVLLSSEINFLNNYLTLEQNSQAQFNYELLADGEVNRTLVPPLLFIPFVQYIVKSINEQRTSIPVSLKIHLKVEENTIIFTCLCLQVNLLEDKGLERIRQRLNLLYGNRYRLFLTTESIWLELKGGEV